MFKNMSKFPRPSLDSALNQLSNHDHSRFLTRTNRNAALVAVKPAVSDISVACVKTLQTAHFKTGYLLSQRYGAVSYRNGKTQRSL